MLSEVLNYYGGQSNQVSYSHYEIGNEIFMRNIQGKTFSCHRLNNVTQVKSSRALAVTPQQIVEMAVNPFKIGFGTVLEVHSLEGLLTIKFKKATAGLLTLTFSNSHTVQYVMSDPTPFVEFLKVKMQQIGIKGDLIKNQIHAKHIETANSFYNATREIEAQFSVNPSYRLIEKIMDLLREAAEQFAEGSDDRYLSVIEHIQKFLQRADVTLILDAALNAKPDPDVVIINGVGSDDVEGGHENEPVVVNSALAAASPIPESPSNRLDRSIDADLAKYDDDLAALMMSPYGNNLRDEEFDEDDVHSVKSGHAELELESMLGDITEEFSILMESFEKSGDILTSVSYDSKGSDEQDFINALAADFDLDDNHFLSRDHEEPLVS